MKYEEEKKELIKEQASLKHEFQLFGIARYKNTCVYERTAELEKQNKTEVDSNDLHMKCRQQALAEYSDKKMKYIKDFFLLISV